MKFAVIQTSGTQYEVKVGDVIEVDRVDSKEGEKIEFDEVLLHVDDDSVAIGKPTLPKTKVVGQVVDHFKGDKVRVATYKSKSRYRRVIGHRSLKTRVKITHINHV